MPDASATRPLRVLTLTPDIGFGGGENRILNLARSVDRSRIEMTVACLYSRDAARDNRSGTLHPEFDAAGVPVRSFDLPRATMRFRSRSLQVLSTAWTLMRAIFRLRLAILALGVDVIDAHMDGTLLIAVAAAVLARRPVTVTLYHVNTVPPNRWLLPFRLLSLRFVSAIITDSAARAGDFARALPKAETPIHVIPNGVRLAAPNCSRSEVLRHFNVPESATHVIGQVSGLVPIKGHLVLLRSVAPILAARPDTYLLCVGFTRESSDHIDRLHREIAELGITEQVRIGCWPGPIADVWNVIDLHVHATLFDSLPNAILEGMSLGKPCVVTAVGGIPDAVLNGKTGLVVPSNNPRLLREALLTLIDNPLLAQRLGEAARRRYLQHYTPERCAREVESALLAVADRNGVAVTALV
ncbi:MAG: glycosyltransferase family 4 protein [Janthinobacterium lividum]